MSGERNPDEDEEDNELLTVNASMGMQEGPGWVHLHVKNVL